MNKIPGWAVPTALVALFALVGGCSVVSWNNDGVAQEEGVVAAYQDNQNVYDAFWKKVQETAQVPDRYKDDFKDVLVGAVEGRYGENGSQAMFQFIQEQNPALDPGLYKQVQQTIEAGRNDFARAQSSLLDRQRRFRTHLRTFPGSLFASALGFPHEIHGELAPPRDQDGDGLLTALDYGIVTSTRTKAAFARGEDEVVDVFGDKSAAAAPAPATTPAPPVEATPAP